jgi:hypothetical protein
VRNLVKTSAFLTLLFVFAVDSTASAHETESKEVRDKSNIKASAPADTEEVTRATQIGDRVINTDRKITNWDWRGNWDWRKDSIQVAQAAQEEGDTAPKSAQCLELEKDIDADMGVMLRAGCQPTLAQMSALMDNPLGNVAMLFTQFDLTKMKNEANGKTANKFNYMGIAQFPKRLNEEWNIINRVVWNVPSMPLDVPNGYGSGPGGEILPPEGSPPAPIDLFDGRTTGFGDVYYNGLFSPVDPIDVEGGGKLVWGAGFDLGIPTASEDILGTGKWLGGPSALGVYLGSKWKVGALVQHFWDFAGDDDRADVNLTNLQYFVFYSLDETTSIGAAPNVIANWEQSSGNEYTVPVGIGISKTVQFGKVPVR